MHYDTIGNFLLTNCLALLPLTQCYHRFLKVTYRFFFGLINRLEIDLLRKDQCSNCVNGNRLKNEQLTVQWLSSTISELRGEISELARSMNTSAELQQQQTFNTDVLIMQNDIISLRHDFESFKGEVAKTSAKLSSLSQDVDVSRQLSQSTAVIVANLTEKVSDDTYQRTYAKIWFVYYL